MYNALSTGLTHLEKRVREPHLHWLAGDGTTFVSDKPAQEELQSLTPPFRLFPNRDVTGCQPKGSRVTQDLDYYATHTATACAQACIAWNAELDASGDDGIYCNAAVWKNNLAGLDPATFIASTGSSARYSQCNCWIKVVKDICGPGPPSSSYEAPGVNFMVMQTYRFPCTPSCSILLQLRKHTTHVVRDCGSQLPVAAEHAVSTAV